MTQKELYKKYINIIAEENAKADGWKADFSKHQTKQHFAFNHQGGGGLHITINQALVQTVPAKQYFAPGLAEVIKERMETRDMSASQAIRLSLFGE